MKGQVGGVAKADSGVNGGNNDSRSKNRARILTLRGQEDTYLQVTVRFCQYFLSRKSNGK
jgi:hypothetical protein